MNIHEKLMTEIYDIVYQLKGCCNMYIDAAEDAECDEKLFDRLNEIEYVCAKLRKAIGEE